MTENAQLASLILAILGVVLAFVAAAYLFSKNYIKVSPNAVAEGRAEAAKVEAIGLAQAKAIEAQGTAEAAAILGKAEAWKEFNEAVRLRRTGRHDGATL